MLNRYFKTIQSIILTSLVLMLGAGLSACDSKPPELMKAVKQFESDEVRDAHVKNMRKNHMDELLHKRDETMIKGIRTEENSLKACISCHVPEKHNGKVLRHTDPEHFCSTCHGYVAMKLDCFQCHVDHPSSNNNQASVVAPNDATHANVKHDVKSTTTEVAELGSNKSTKQPIGEK